MIELAKAVVVAVYFCKMMPDAGLPMCIGYSIPVRSIDQCQITIYQLIERYTQKGYYLPKDPVCQMWSGPEKVPEPEPEPEIDA